MEPRKKTFPVKFLISKPTKENPRGTCQSFYAHEWEAYQKSLPPEQRDADFIDPDPVPAAAPTDPPGPAPAPPEALATNPSESSISSASTPSIHRNFSIPPDFSRHARSCIVCSHPERDAIEADFIRWRSPELIAREYKIANRSSIYRHAHSTGLFAWRKQELSRTLESILECAEQVPLESADIIIRAARIYSHLDEHGYWFEPPSTNFVFHGPAPADYPLESALPTNTARVRKPPLGDALEIEPDALTPSDFESSSNIPPSKNSVNSLNPEEKANS